MPALLLASGSPRRSQLLKAAGYRFKTVQPGISERADPHLSARELTAWNAMRKGLAAAQRYPGCVVLAADTVVVLDNEIIGKPKNMTNATEILQRLSGRTHHVYSSVFIVYLHASQMKLFCELSRVHFRKLSRKEIRSYLAKVNPLDKAGAYAAQGYGSEIIQRISGSYSNVVGLPMEQTTPALKQFGIKPVSRRLPFPAEPAREHGGVRAEARRKGTRR